MNSITPSQVSVVLVEPTQPGNVGSAARAMDNMGVTDLRLVNPCHYFHAEARMFSMNARYILHKAVTFKSLEEAVEGYNLIIGTTAREREKIKKLTSIYRLPEILKKFNAQTKIAIVFGPEQSGLNNNDLNICNEWIFIPSYGKSSSLNLSQAVMVTLYELSKLYDAKPIQQEKQIEPASSKNIEGMKEHFFRVLEKTNFLRRSSRDTLWTSFSDLIGRAKPDERDVRMIRGFFNRIEITLEKRKKKS